MDPFLRFVIRWGAIILAFDAVASLTADASGMPRGWFSVGSAILFFLVGVRGRIRLGPKLALRAAIVVATIDATLGWAILWFAGPGRPVGTAPLSALLVGGVSAVLVGSVIALLGVVAGRVFLRSESPGVTGVTARPERPRERGSRPTGGAIASPGARGREATPDRRTHGPAPRSDAR